MSVLAPAVKAVFLTLSQQKALRSWAETSPLAKRLTSQFVPGLTLDDGVQVAATLRSQGILTSLDYLGENVATLPAAQLARDAYLAALNRISTGLPATISMKISSLGLDVSEEACAGFVDELCRKAQTIGSVVEFDMEDSRYTDRNVRMVRAMHQAYGSVRAVIQAYLYRSEKDVEEICDLKIPIRLCKGAYREPPSVAWPEKRDVDLNYVKLLKLLLSRGTYPAIATHDEEMITRTITYAGARKVDASAFEFQMLYGVRPKLQSRVSSQGFRLRLYVPYGEAWYPYFMRRLGERPANVLFLAKSVLSG